MLLSNPFVLAKRVECSRELVPSSSKKKQSFTSRKTGPIQHEPTDVALLVQPTPNPTPPRSQLTSLAFLILPSSPRFQTKQPISYPWKPTTIPPLTSRCSLSPYPKNDKTPSNYTLFSPLMHFGTPNSLSPCLQIFFKTFPAASTRFLLLPPQALSPSVRR